MGQETLKDKTAKGLFWGALNNGTMQLLNIVIGVFLARLLSPDDYGLVGMLAVFTAVAGALQESGFTSALANMERPSDNDYNAVFWFSTLVGWVSYIVLFFSAPLIAGFFHHAELIDLSRFIFVSLLFSSIGTTPAAYLFKNMMVRETTLLRVSSLTISGIVGIVLAFRGYAYWSLAWQQVLYIMLTSLGRFFIIPWRPSFHIDFTPVRTMFSFSYKILITTVVNTLSQNILTFIFGRLYPAKAVGNFSQAFKWDTMASTFVSGTIAQVAQPVLVEVNDDKERQTNVFRKMLRFTAFLAFPAMFGLSMVSREFIVLLISDKWTDSIPLLRILCVSGAFLPFYTMYQNLIISRGKSAVYMWCTIALIVAQTAFVVACYREGIVLMVSAYTAITILWLFVWQYFAGKETGLRLRDVLKDICPYLFASAAVMFLTYFSTDFIENLLLLLVARVALATTLYFTIMKLAGSKILVECMNYLHRKGKRK
ncbi:lipopolysaccharide biosynthesis protein [Prevotella dentasini]|uniref:lipopolysaccharide biosynthesis protein n=1 Tax=Prevotella dentasini TaxID=589537 RepID=UPI00046A3EB5|nr:lipopolysaccharide biosynthesis protein [Prevotella dentasini]